MKKFKVLSVLMTLLLVFTLVGCNQTQQASITGIEIASKPTKVDYFVGQKLDTAGLVVNAVYSDNTKKAVTDYTVDKTEALTLEDKEVTVTYKLFTAKFTISVVRASITDVELKVEENVKYKRGTDISALVSYRTLLNDGSKGEWVNIANEDITKKTFKDNDVLVEVNLIVNNVEFNKSITVPMDNSYITIGELLTKEVGETEYMVHGTLISMATTVDADLFMLADNTTGDIIGVTGLGAGGRIHKMNFDTNGLKVGDELIIPVTLKQSTVKDNYSDSGKLYADYSGFSDHVDSCVVSHNNEFNIPEDKVTQINNQEELQAFLSNANRSNNFYKFIKLRGEISFILYNASRHFRFYFGNLSYNDHFVDGQSPVFTDGTQTYTTGTGFEELVLAEGQTCSEAWSNPTKVVKEITALFVGGNAYYHEFAILKAEDVKEVTPILTETKFNNPTNLKYTVGDTFNIAGAEVVYSYDFADNKVVPVTMEMLDQTTLPNMNAAGNYKVKGSYEGFNFEFVVEVTAKVATSIELDGKLDKTTYHLRGSLQNVIDELAKLNLTVTYEDSTVETIPVTANMVTCADEWTLGSHEVTINYLNKSINLTITVENQGLTIEQLKTKPLGEDVYDLQGVVISSYFTSGTTKSPVGPELLIRQKGSNLVIGIKGLVITYENKLAGLELGDEILIQVQYNVATTNSKYSENGKPCAIAVEGDIIVLSKGNDTLLDVAQAKVISNQEQLNALISGKENRAANAYQLVKLCAGAIFANYSLDTASTYVTYSAANSGQTKVDGMAPYFHEFNEMMTLNGQTYVNMLFGKDATRNVNFTGESLNRTTGDIYVMYVGGQGIYYHQFIILGPEYVTTEAEKHLSEIVYTEPTKYLYNVNDPLDFTGGKIEYLYDYIGHNETIVLNENLLAEPVDMTTAGAKTLKFVYKDITYTKDIFVQGGEVTSIEVATNPTQEVFGIRERINTIDLTGATIKLNYADGLFTTIPLTREMLPATDEAWKIGENTYVVTYKGLTCDLVITYANIAKSVTDFKAAENGEYDIRGIVLGANTSYDTTWLMIKDVNSNEIIGIANTGVTGAWNGPKLNTEVVNIGDEIMVTVFRKVVTSGVNVGRIYADTWTNKQFTDTLMILSTGNQITWDWTTANPTVISTQEEFAAYMSTSNRFFNLVKMVGVQAIRTGAHYKIFFAGNKDGSTQAINGQKPWFCDLNVKMNFPKGIDSYFENAASKDYNAPAKCTKDVYAVYLGGNKWQTVWTFFGPDFFVDHVA